MTRRVLFAVAPPETTARHVQPPIEALTCAAILEARRFQVFIHDQRVADSLPDGDFDLVLLLTQTYDRTQCYSLRLDHARELAEAIRDRIGVAVPLVACGVHADLEPAMTARELGMRCLPGEIEASVPWLCERLFNDGDAIDDIDLSGAPRQVDPDEMPIPRFESVDLSRYRGEIIDGESGVVSFGRAGLLFENRGCPYNCSYCHLWFGRKLRMRSPSKVVDDVRALRDAGTHHFFFLDYTFTFDRDWTLSVCQELTAADLGVTWVAQTRCENVDREILSAMRAAGCVGVFYGIETPRIAEAGVRKRTKREVIDNAIATTVAVGLHPMVFILLGLEAYGQQRQDELVAWLSRLPATFSARPLLPRPRTHLFDSQADTANALTWSDLENQAIRLGFEYWPLELDELQQRLLMLPNNILNAPTED
jgi:anaerobic magnesium-protoporphyrin IX monomethyl ester cyclase